MPIRFDVLTLFPEIFRGYLSQSILKHALERGLVEVHLWNFRDWAKGKRKNVDDRPYGGGPGMVLMCEPVIAAVEAVQALAHPPGHIVLLTPSGERLTQELVRQLAQHPRLLLLCGRYEGFDERIRLLLQPQEISIGDYVCNGGEVPAMVIIDTVIRLVPGVLGKSESVVEESHAEPGLVEYPQYTRPRVFRGLAVPEVLLSGNHGKIAEWRRQQALLRSQQRQARHCSPPSNSTEPASQTPAPGDSVSAGAGEFPSLPRCGQGDRQLK
ncbi:tRNA (guanine-N(1)-)-methyltransferase [bacterium HR36]|nr:tRNA (guanine-N(1)-)-methyltransferase [bacterium HR36]